MGDNTEQQPAVAVVRRVPNTLAVMSDAEINRSWRLAEALASSGQFPDVKSTAAAFAVMLVGHDLGMSPTQALMGIHLIKGHPQIASTSLAGFIKTGGAYDYRVVKHSDQECAIEFGPAPAPRANEPWPEAFSPLSEFSMTDAVAAELVTEVAGEDDQPPTYKRKSGASEGWEKYPRNMLFARAMSNGVKWHCPDVMNGVPVYTEGDSFEERPALSARSGDGAAQGLDLGVKVEKVIARAEGLGHAGLSDRAAIEMTLGGRSPAVAATWARKAEVELNALAEGAMEEAEIVEPTPAERIRRALVLREEAEKETDTTVAEGLRQRADIEEAKALELTMDGGDVAGDD